MLPQELEWAQYAATMLTYIMRRTAQLIPTLLAVTIVTFLLIRLTPGNPASTLLGPLATPAAIARIRVELGLDKPLYVQYVIWIWRALHLNFGTSYVNLIPAGPYAAGKMVNSLLLIGTALVISSTIGIITGLVSAVHRGSRLDRGVMLGALLGLSFPDFWIGLMLILIFAVALRILPAGGMFVIGDSRWSDIPSHIILPALSLAAATTAVMARVTRSAVGESMRQGYVIAVRARGAGPIRLNVVHVLRNALIPVATLLGIQLGFLLGGDIVIEYVFSWPGIGLTLLNAVQAEDYSVIEACVFLIAFAYMIGTLLVDVAYYVLDPRIRQSAERR